MPPLDDTGQGGLDLSAFKPLDLSGFKPIEQTGSEAQQPSAPPQGLDLSAFKPLDLSGFRPIDQPPQELPSTGLIGAVTSGVLSGVRGLGQTAEALSGGQPAAPPQPKTIAEQPVELADLAHPFRLGEKVLYQMGASAPSLTAGIVAGGAAMPAGPLAGLGAGALAAGAVSAVQALGPIYGEELAKDAKDPEGAWNRALARAGKTGAFGTLGWAAFGVAPFAGAVKNLLFQAFVMQPGLSVGERALENQQQGKPIGEGLGDAYAGGVAGTAIPIVGIEGARYLGRRIAGRTEAQAQGAPPEISRPTADAEPPPQAPATGATIGVQWGNEGVKPMTVAGYSPDGQMARLTDADGARHLIRTGDLLPRIAEIPQAEQLEAGRPAAEVPEDAPDEQQHPAVTTEAPQPPAAGRDLSAAQAAEQAKLPPGYQIVPPDATNPRFSVLSPENEVIAEAPHPGGLASHAIGHAGESGRAQSVEELADQRRMELLRQAEAAPEHPAIDELGDRVDDLFTSAEADQVSAPMVEQIRADHQELGQQTGEALEPMPEGTPVDAPRAEREPLDFTGLQPLDQPPERPNLAPEAGKIPEPTPPVESRPPTPQITEPPEGTKYVLPSFVTAGLRPERPPEVASPTTIRTDVPPRVGLADWVKQQFERGTPISAKELQAAAEVAFEGKMAAGKFTRADMYEALELGINQFIATHPERFDPRASLPQAQDIARSLDQLKSQIPTQTVRAGEKDRFQQFSTPPDYAYATAWLANIRPTDHVIEPSAGTGSLMVHGKNAGPASVITNELSEARNALLQTLSPDRSFSENAEQLHNILPEDVKPSVVIMNPPFSQTAGRMADKKVIETGARHIEQALARLEPGGRLVAIVGRGMGPGMARFADWWSGIGREYDVRANVGVSGDVYKKYGTTFGTRLLVIDKTLPSGRPPILGEAESIPDLMQRLNGVRDDRPAAAEPIEARSGEPGQPVAVEPSGVPVAPQVGEGDRPAPPVSDAAVMGGVRGEPSHPGPGPEVLGGPAIGGEPTTRPEIEAGPSDAVVPVEPEQRGPSGAERPAEEPVGAEPGLGGGGPEPDGVAIRPEGERGSVLPSDGEPQGLEAPAAVRVDEVVAEPNLGTGEPVETVYEPYRPQRIKIEGAKEHPGDLVQSAAMASVMPPAVDYAPRLPPELIASGGLSDAQLEAITYAGHAHSQILPAVEGETPLRRGFFIGDGTGVGKGREIAGILLDNWMQGRRKAVWVSENKTLLNDARRDWGGLGRDPKQVFDVGKVKSGADLTAGEGIGFVTYDTLKGSERLGKDKEGKTVKGKSRLDQLVNWLGKDFDGVIAFDEAHNMGNAIETKGKRGKKEAAAKALAGLELQQQLPNARIVYVSATGATEVANLAYADRLGLWGRGTAFPNRNAFIQAVGSGGIAAMELVARDMKAMGSYVARNLSYDKVKYDRVEHKLTPEQREIYDELATGWQSVLNNMEQALVKTSPDPEAGADSRQRSAALSAFWSGHQRFFNQIITAMQMPSVLRSIEKDLSEGKQAVLQLVNTNEASQTRALERARMEDGDLEDLDLTPKDQLMQMIEKSFPVAQMEQFVDENGNVRSRPVQDSHGNIVENREALAMREDLLRRLGSIRVPQGPLEMLLDHFGTDKVAEVTGRKQRVVNKADEKGQMRKTQETRSGDANAVEADAFQNGKKPILVFSQAGGTGRSYHADLSAPSKDAQRIHYLLQAGWRADKAIQGFGRTHRTNQASAPVFNLVTTDLEGQRRFISSIARRLSQLGALTKGERRAGEQGMFSARDNLESPEASAALRNFWRSLDRGEIQAITGRDFERQTGLKLRDSNGNPNEPPDITQFLNRLLSLKFDMQNAVFGEFETRLHDAVDQAAALGTLDVGTETLRADRITKAAEKTVYTDPQSGAETKYVRLNVENRTHPATFDEISEGRKLTAGRQPVSYVVSKRTGKIFAVAEASATTDAQTGDVTPMYRLAGPLDWNYAKRANIDGPGAERNWEKVEDLAKAREMWEAQVAQIPEYSSRDEHLITGAILPIWDRIAGQPKVYRLQTSDGERMLGRVVDEQRIGQVLRALGAEEAGKQYTPAEVAERVLAGDRATLANEWVLKRSMVANEPRIELIGPSFREQSELERSGVFTERIGWNTRYFVPTGPQAERIISDIVARRPVISMQGGREEGLAQRERPEMAAAPTIDTLPEAQPYRLRHPEGLAGGHQAAAEYVRQVGEQTGNEHFAAVGPGGEIQHAGTSGYPDFIRFSDEMVRGLWDPQGSPIAYHHNHPSGTPVSVADMGMLAAPNMRSITAHAPDGNVSSATLSANGRAALEGMEPSLAEDRIRDWGHQSEELVYRILEPLVDRKMLPASRANVLLAEGRNRLLAASGLIDYISTRELPGWLQQKLRAATPAFGEQAREVSDRLHRSAGALRPEEAMAGVSRSHEEVAAGRPAGEVGDRGGEPGAGEPGTTPGSAPRGLAEDADFSDRATDEALAQAGDPNEPNYPERLQRTLASGPESPGAARRDFNVINKNWTTFLTKGRTDPMSAPKVQVELQRIRDANEFLHSYRQGLESWQGKDPAQWRKVFSALELLTLEGTDVPLDGRAIIVENADRPLAALSKPGDMIALTTPEEIRMFSDYIGTMKKVWGDVVAETARRFGWEGAPTSRAMFDAAREMNNPRLERAAKIVAAVEYQQRSSYLPLMRSGDYYLRVTPRAGTPEWAGEGYAPTTYFSLIDGRTPWERFIGGAREGTPKTAAAAIARLREQFPAGQYDIDHGWMHRPEETIRNLNIPAVEKLMMLIGGDVRSQMRDRFEDVGMSADEAQTAARREFDRIVDAVGDEILASRVIGPRRQRAGVPGYDADFAKSTGKYMNSMAHHVSNIRNGEAIDAANQMIAEHPDPRTRAYFRDWDRRMEDFGEQLDGPLNKMRQAAFYWFLGGNAASTMKILLHGPLLGVPTLTTGLGLSGRTQATATYLGAIKDLMPGMHIGAKGPDVDIARGAKTDAERALIEDSEAKGFLHPHGADELAAIRWQGEQALEPQQRFLRRVLDIWGSNIAMADRLIRGGMLLSAHRIASREGMDTINRIWSRDELWNQMPVKTPETFAQFMIDRSVGLWGNVNRMPVMRSQLGGMIGQFRNYEILWLSNLHNMATKMGPEGKVTAALMLGGLGMLGGAAALPFIEDGEKAAEFVYKTIYGIEPDLENKLRRAINTLVPGSSIGDEIIKGPRPFGVDTGSLGFGDIIGRQLQSPLAAIGAAPSAFLGGPYRAWERARTEQGPLAAVRELMPSAVKNMIGALYPETMLASATSGAPILAPQQLSDADRIKRGLGWTPEIQAKAYEKINEQRRATDAHKAALTIAENRIANLTLRGLSTKDAEKEAETILQSGMKDGVWSADEVKVYKAKLTARLKQRLHPEIPSKAMQRFEQAHQPHP